MCRRVEVEVEVEYYRTCSVCSLCARRGFVCLKIIERSFFNFFFASSCSQLTPVTVVVPLK